jgi:Flp pilus assembly protein TadB
MWWWLEWCTLAVAAAGVVWRLTWLVRSRGSDQQSEDEDSGPDGSRRESWSFIRYMLACIAGAATLLIGVDRWVGLGVVTAFLVLAFGTDFAGRRRRARVGQS